MVLRVDRGERKIGLSRKKAHWTKEDGEEEGGEGASTESPAGETKPENRELKGGLGGGGPLFSLGGEVPAESESEE